MISFLLLIPALLILQATKERKEVRAARAGRAVGKWAGRKVARWITHLLS